MNNASHALGDYKVGKRIASGGFGFVYGGKAPDGKKVAIKYERTYNKIARPYLKHETDVYRLLEGHPCVPKVYAYGREGRWNIMVFDLLGTSLETLFEKCNGKFSLKTTLMLAPQIIDCIEYCHSKGIIHRDIKPDNFLMGTGDRANIVHIIDFGLARRFQHPKTLEHFPYFEGHNFFGTTRFASLKALEGCSQSRRDDLESAAYSLIYFMRGRLPWQGLRGGTDKHRDQRVREKKKAWTPQRLCEGLPEELAKMLEYIKGLTYTDEPDYEYLRGLFQKRFEKEGFELDYDYDWLHVVEEESNSESGNGGSIPGSRRSSRPGRTTGDRISVDSGSADDEVDGPARNESRYTASKDPSVSVRDERREWKTGGEVSPISGANVLSTNKAARHSSRSSFVGSNEKKSDISGSDVRSSESKSSKAQRRTRSSDSRWSSSSSTAAESPIKKGDFVLIKFLARDTLEEDGAQSDSSAPIDNSYWHNPSLSEDEWHFPYRPAIVTKVTAGDLYTRLFVLPIMQRADGLEKVSPARRPAFFQICSSNEAGPISGSDEDSAVKFSPTPDWTLDNTYVHHQYDVFRILVPTEATKDIKVVWHFEKQQMRRVLRVRDDVMKVLNDDSYLSDAGSETMEVRGRQRKRRVIVHYPVFGDIATLDEEAFARSDVELKGSNGWLPEFFKVDRRRNHENGYYTGDSDCSMDDENESMYTGPAPGNRRLSCTLAIDGDVIVEAASVSGSDRGSESGSRYRSPSSSKGSYRSKSSKRSSGANSLKSGAGSAPASALDTRRSLRRAVLNSAARSGYLSATSSQRSNSGSGSEHDSGASVVSLPVKYGPGSSSDVESAAGSSTGSADRSSRASSDANSSARSVVGSAAGSVASFVRSVTESLVGSGIGGVNHKASAVEGKIMVDRAVQTDAAGEDINQAASKSTRKVMVNKATQTEI